MDAILEGLEEVLAKIDREAEELARKQERGMTKACLIVEAYAKEHMSPESPSSPGEPPAVVTGQLRASIGHQVVEEDGKVVGYVGVPAAVPYGEYLEFGTSRMQPRPFLNPALGANRAEITEAIREELAK